MSKSTMKKLRDIRYTGVREWPGVSIRLHDDLLAEIDKLAEVQHVSRNELIFNTLRMFMMSQQAGGDIMNSSLGEMFMDMMTEQASKYFGVSQDIIKERFKSDITNSSSDK